MMWPCSVATLTTVELLAVWDGGPVVVDSTPGKMQAIGSAIAASTAVVVVRVAGGRGVSIARGQSWHANGWRVAGRKIQ